jgi:hypothetical protein
MKIGKKAKMVIGTIIAAPFLAFYSTFICGVPLLWPYYKPEMEGVEIIDPAAWFLPRANLTPYAKFPLRDGMDVRIWSNCYPLKENGYRACSLKMRFSIPSSTDISFAQIPIEVTSPNGEDLVDVESYEKFAGRMPNVLRDGKVFIEYSDFMRSASVSLSARTSHAFTARVPDIIIEGERIAVPEIRFTRVDNLTCVGFFSNF